MFGKLKDWFGKEEPLGNPTVMDLDVNFVFDYDLKTWTVTEVFEYDWGNENFSYEFQVTDGIDTRFLSVEKDDELVIGFHQKKKLYQISTSLADQLHQADEPPREIVSQGEVYFQVGQYPGYMKPQSKEENEWDEFISWTYDNKNNNKVITIEQWGENDYEASEGIYLKPHQVTNILPA